MHNMSNLEADGQQKMMMQHLARLSCDIQMMVRICPKRRETKDPSSLASAVQTGGNAGNFMAHFEALSTN